MNKDRRTRLNKILTLVTEARVAAEEVRDAEQDAYDGMRENLQQGDKGLDMEANTEELGELVKSLEDAEDKINDTLNR